MFPYFSYRAMLSFRSHENHRTTNPSSTKRMLVMLTSRAQSHDLVSLADLELCPVRGAVVIHEGKRAVQLTANGEQEVAGEPLAIIPGSSFADGMIEAEIAGVAHADALGYSRGFVGIAFRVQPGGA